ncbi:MAG TPA: type II secretion system protein GspK [Candidatus Omnitrophota bacterium]|nr:type II secretion system protein GspK [Candidatus Omnitrophota bacterium]
MKRNLNQHATVLIFALCVLSVLTMFAVSVGVQIRQSFTMVARLNGRDQVDWLTRSGTQLARYVILHGPYAADPFKSGRSKQHWFNNPELFKDIRLSTGGIELVYERYDDAFSEQPVRVYGLEDEGGKINMNIADRSELIRLFQLAGRLTQTAAEDLASAILDWRQTGETDVSGFDGENYYTGLAFPYSPKKGPFENLSELLLVKGMNPEILNRLRAFITVYGQGKVNINTASPTVLMALGMSSHTAQLLAEGRKGPDGEEGTADDFIFRTPDGVSLGLKGFLELTAAELAEIDMLYVGQKISIDSEYVTARVRAYLPYTQENRSIDCVFRVADGKITEWR